MSWLPCHQWGPDHPPDCAPVARERDGDPVVSDDGGGATEERSSSVLPLGGAQICHNGEQRERWTDDTYLGVILHERSEQCLWRVIASLTECVSFAE